MWCLKLLEFPKDEDQLADSKVPSALSPSWETMTNSCGVRGTSSSPSSHAVDQWALTCVSEALHWLSCDQKALPFAVHELILILPLTRQHKVLCQRVVTRQPLPCPPRYSK